MDIVLQIVGSAEYWFGVISAITVLAVGLLVFLVFLPGPEDALTPATPMPDWLKTHDQLTRDELTRAAAARKARADARQWPGQPDRRERQR